MRQCVAAKPRAVTLQHSQGATVQQYMQQVVVVDELKNDCNIRNTVHCT